ncbi:MAG: hypothetical protein HQ515_10825, partial [Phycisphaeraceae bacterium]|nr:hypothetical protein [Phycisphaeraceae bacterium]
MKKVVYGSLIFLWLVPVCTGNPILSPAYPGTDPGKARVSIQGQTMTLANSVLKAQWKIRQGHIEFESVLDCLHGDTVTGGKDLFKIVLSDGRVMTPSVMTMTTAPGLHGLVPQPHARIAAQRTGGQALRAEWTHASTGLTVQWQAMLRHGSNALRTELTLAASKLDIALADIILAELDVPGAKLAGEVKGSPITTDILFFALEHPLAENSLTGDTVLCHYPCRLTLKPNQSITCSAVIGTVPSGQMRRGFLYYLERERAHPYRPFLHYNSWYHLNIGRPNAHMTETELLEAVNAVGTELVSKRGVTLDSFVPDDGWDDFNTLWGFHNDFPNGFTKVAQQTKHFQAGLGVWM